MRCFLPLLGAITCLAGCSGAIRQAAPETQRPNIVLAIADDWSYPHASTYGDAVVSTPAFDRIAREGMLFRNAYVAAPSCTPSRGAILTGQDVWRLREGGNLWSDLPADIPTYTGLLAAAGYFVGLERKGWGPGRSDSAAGRLHNPAGRAYRSFRSFMEQRPKGQPFCYWFGSQDPHRPYEKGAGKAAGLNRERVRVPAWWPDNDAVREDLLDYYFEVERFDREVSEILRVLEEQGELENTIIVMTADNGMPFPRAKANLYDGGTHVPLAIRWPGRAARGRATDDFVNLKDLAVTFVDAAGLSVPVAMTGSSLAPLLLSGKSRKDRDHVITARERHAWVRQDGLGYPARAIRTKEYLYIVNLEPTRWPAGDPDPQFNFSGHGREMGTQKEGYGDIDPSPTKDCMLDQRAELPYLFDKSFGRRPSEELYILAEDPDQMQNVAGETRFVKVKAALRKRLLGYLEATEDPRMSGPAPFDAYPYFGRRSPDAERRGQGVR